MQLDNSSGDVAFKTGKIEFNPSTLLTGNEYFQMASCFEMYRVKRARVYVQPAFASYSPTGNVSLASTAASTVWIVSDWTKNETNVGNSDIKNYQNCRFHTLSLNSLKKICDTQVRMYRRETADQALTAGVMPMSYWVDTSFAGPGTFSYCQYLIELPGFDGTSINYRPKYRFIYELDIEFKQPGTSIIPQSFSAETVLGASLELGSYPSLDPPVVGGFTKYTVIGYKSQEVAGQQTLTFRLSDSAPAPSFLNLTATVLRQIAEDRTYLGQDAIYTGPTIPSGLF